MLQGYDIEEAIALLLKRAEEEILLQDNFASRRFHDDSTYKKQRPSKGRHYKTPSSTTSTEGNVHLRGGFSDGSTTRHRKMNSSYTFASTGGGGRGGKNRSPRLNHSIPPTLSSLNDFPPIGGSRDAAERLQQTTQRPANSTSGAGQKKSRRITPTPLTHYEASGSFSAPQRTWALHPAFVGGDEQHPSQQPSPCEDARFHRQQSVNSKEKENTAKEENHSPMSVQIKETHRVTGSEHGASDVGIDRGIPLLLNDVTHKEELNKLALKYIQHMKSSHVANVGSSLQQLMRLLTLSNDLKMWKEFKDEENQTEGSSVPLRTLSNCCYFVAKVLEGNKDLLLLFAKETLHVLSVNPRLSEMSPQLKMWLEETCIAKSAEYEEVPSSESSSVFGVTFDSERDGKENFPGDKAFNAFRRQRDAFYDLYQQWRSLTDLNRDELVAKRARAILMMEGVCSQAALAQLFLLQLMKSCTSKDPSQGVDDSLTESLKQANPTKLKKLTERFTGPLQRGSRQVKRFFDGEEEFFYKFLVYSDSYNFSENLKCILVAEVHKMNNPSILYGSPRDYQITVHKLQLLVKFLGLIVCQPYKDTTAGVSDWGRAKGRCASEVLAYPINVKSTLQSALREHHVLLTLPWVVGYLVVMGLGQERREDETLTDVLNILFGLLRTCSQNQILGSRGQFLIVLSIGYLIENQGFMTLYRASLEKEVDPVIKEWAATFASSKGCLDSLNIVTSKVLNLCSPVFDEVHSILVQFSIGHKVPPTPARKIKPVPVFPALFGGERSKMKEEELIEEAFMASQPTFVKQLCDVVATRLAANMESACKEHIIPCAVQSGLHQMADVVRKKLKEKLLSEDTPTTSVDFLNQSEVSSALALTISHCIKEAHSEIIRQTDEYCQDSTSRVFDVLIKPALTQAACGVTERICMSWARHHLMKWIQSSLAVKVQDQLQKNFEKMKRAVHSGTKASELFLLSPLTQQLLQSHLLMEKRQSQHSLHLDSCTPKCKKREESLDSTHQPITITPKCERVATDTAHHPANSTPMQESTNICSAHQPTSSTPSSEHMVIDVAQQPASPTPKPTSSTPGQEHMKTDFTHQPTSSTPRPTSSTPKQEVGVSNSTDQLSTGPSHLVLPPSLTANNPCSPLTLSSVVDTSVLSNSVCLHCKNKDHFSLPLAELLQDLQNGSPSTSNTSELLSRAVECTAAVLGALYTDCTIEGIVVPMLMNDALGHTLADVTVKISIELMTQGATLAVDGQLGSLLFDVWRLLKACKINVPWQQFLQNEKCLERDSPAILGEVGSCLGNLVAKNIATSWEVEALWIATLRFQKLRKSKVAGNCVRAAVIFLNSYFLTEAETNLNRENSSSQASDPTSPVHIHFIQLLCYVCSRTTDSGDEGSQLTPQLVAIATRMGNKVF